MRQFFTVFWQFNTVFSDNEIPREKIHYSYIAPICIDSTFNLNEENYPQVYL